MKPVALAVSVLEAVPSGPRCPPDRPSGDHSTSLVPPAFRKHGLTPLPEPVGAAGLLLVGVAFMRVPQIAGGAFAILVLRECGWKPSSRNTGAWLQSRRRR
jgi:hypothetical protein